MAISPGRIQAFYVTSTLFLATAIGCGGDNLVPMSGSISLNGKPFEDVYVVFEPVEGDASQISTGKTNETGAYVLTNTSGKAGCRVGEHKVLLTTVPPNAMDDERTPLPKDRIPSRYQTDPLKFEVPDQGTDNADFDLKR